MKRHFSLFLFLLVVVIVAVGAVVVIVVEGGKGTEVAQTVIVNLDVSQNINDPLRLNSANGLDGSTNANAPIPSGSDADTSKWSTYRNQDHEYSINYPTDWIRVEEVKDLINTFLPENKELESKCSLKVHNSGLLGHGISLSRAEDQVLSVAGNPVTKRNWSDESGALAYFNFELERDIGYIGIEGYVGTDVPNCETILERIFNSLTL